MSSVLAITVSMRFVATGIAAGHEYRKQEVACQVLSSQERGKLRGVDLFERLAGKGILTPQAHQDLQLLTKNRPICLKA